MEKSKLLSGKPFNVIMAFSTPLIISGAVTFINTLINTLVLGRFMSTGIAISYSVGQSLAFITSLLAGLAAGACAIIAQRRGAGDETKLRIAYVQSLFFVMGISVAVTAPALLASAPLLRLMKAPAEIFGSSLVFMRITLCTGILVVFNSLTAGTIRAMGDSRSSIYFVIISAVLSMAVNALFVWIFRLGVIGAAFGTLSANAVLGIIYFVYLHKKFPVLRLSKKDFRIDRAELAPIAANGVPIGIQGVICGIGSFVLQRCINTLGVDAITAISLASQAFSLFTLVLTQVHAASAVYCGQNFGAGKIDRVFKGIRVMSLATVIYCVIFTAVLFFAGAYYCSVFISAEQFAELKPLITAAVRLLVIVCPFYGFLSLFRGTVDALGYGRWDAIEGFVEAVVYCLMGAAVIYFGFYAAGLAKAATWTIGCVWIIIAWFIIRKHVRMKGMEINNLYKLLEDEGRAAAAISFSKAQIEEKETK